MTTRALSGTRPRPLPRRHRRPPLPDRFRLRRHRPFDPPQQVGITQRGGELPRQLLDLLHQHLDTPLPRRPKRRAAHQRFRFAAFQTQVQHGDGEVTQTPPYQFPEVMDDLLVVVLPAQPLGPSSRVPSYASTSHRPVPGTVPTTNTFCFFSRQFKFLGRGFPMRTTLREHSQTPQLPS